MFNQRQNIECLGNHERMNDLQTKMTVFNVLIDVYKILSIEIHRGESPTFMNCCPTCIDGYLMKEEYQTFVDSIRECLPIKNVSVDDEEDPLRFEKISSGSLTFLENQSGDRNFVQSFITQADVSRQSSNCDIAPPALRNKDSMTKDKQKMQLPCRTMRLHSSSNINELSNRCLTTRARTLHQSLIKPTFMTHVRAKEFERYFSNDCRYNPFRMVNNGPNDGLKMALFFTSIKDRYRYQASDRSGTFLRELEDVSVELMYDFDGFADRFRDNAMGEEDIEEHPMWREQNLIMHQKIIYRHCGVILKMIFWLL